LIPAEAKDAVCVRAPYRPNDSALQRRIGALRARGTPVVIDLPRQDGERGELKCNRELLQRDGKWTVENLQPRGRKRAPK
jgi:ATP phosphoribosyltransferase regulatory subunit